MIEACIYDYPNKHWIRSPPGNIIKISILFKLIDYFTFFSYASGKSWGGGEINVYFELIKLFAKYLSYSAIYNASTRQT